MSHRTPWTRALLDHLRHNPETRLTPDEVHRMFGMPVGTIPIPDRLEKLYRGGLLRRTRCGDVFSYQASEAGIRQVQAPKFCAVGRGAHRVASVFEFARVVAAA